MDMVKNLALRLFLLVLVVCVTGCYQRDFDGHQATYHALAWIGPLIICISLAGYALGFWLWKRYAKAGLPYMLMLLFLSTLLLVILAPSTYTDRVIVDDEHFEARYGFWFNPTVKTIRFSDLREIQYKDYHDNDGFTGYRMDCVALNGQVTTVFAGDLVKETVTEIFAKARTRGVTVIDRIP
jgi:hypothetical protein